MSLHKVFKQVKLSNMFFVDADLSDKSIKGIVDKSCGRQLSLTLGERLSQVIVIQHF